MSLKSWIDGLLLGRQATARAREAEARLHRADAVRDALDMAEGREIDRLTSLTRDVHKSAAQAAETPPRPARVASLPEIDPTPAAS